MWKIWAKMEKYLIFPGLSNGICPNSERHDSMATTFLTLSNLGLSIPLSNLGGGIRLSSIAPDSFDGLQ